jgi:hypothetical protein
MKQVLLLYLVFVSVACVAQEIPNSTQQQLENLGVEDLEDDALLQNLEFLRKHPINLNTATLEELQPLRLLTDLQIIGLIRHRNLFGKLIDIYELQAIPTFDILTIQKIRPYVFIGPATNLQQTVLSRFKGGDQYALLRLSRVIEKSKGYDTSLNTHYLGDRNHLLFRYRYQYKNLLYYGIVADKDAGEPFLSGAQKLGFDFYSIHLFLRNLGKIKALAIGDYVVNLGQGLTQWQSLGFGKSVDVMNIKRQSPILLPYRSSGEFYFNRGVAITIGWRQFDVTAFASYKNFSGNLDVDSATDRFTSFGTSGYYRTALEIADRNRLMDFCYGGNISFRKTSFKLGINGVAHSFSKPMEKRNDPYNYFAFSGRETFNGSIDYSYTYKNVHFFGELAIDKNLHRALVQGAMISVDKRVDISVFYRNLSKKYQSLYGNAFSENSLPSNEQGLYAGILIRPQPKWQLAAYADYYQFDFLKYRISAPTKGYDYLFQLIFIPDKKTEVYLRYRTETKPIDETATGLVMDFPVAKAKQSLRLHFNSQVNSFLGIKGRTEMIWYDKRGIDKQEGFLSYIEIAGQPINKLKGNIRLQYFETGSYDSRIYVYESDVLYGYSIPAFYDKGFRYYINTNYAVSKNFTIWIRIAQTVFANKSIIGSGLDEIKGNHRTEINLQLRYLF